MRIVYYREMLLDDNTAPRFPRPCPLSDGEEKKEAGTFDRKMEDKKMVIDAEPRKEPRIEHGPNTDGLPCSVRASSHETPKGRIRTRLLLAFYYGSAHILLTFCSHPTAFLLDCCFTETAAKHRRKAGKNAFLRTIKASKKVPKD